MWLQIDDSVTTDDRYFEKLLRSCARTFHTSGCTITKQSNTGDNASVGGITKLENTRLQVETVQKRKPQSAEAPQEQKKTQPDAQHLAIDSFSLRKHDNVVLNLLGSFMYLRSHVPPNPDRKVRTCGKQENAETVRNGTLPMQTL